MDRLKKVLAAMLLGVLPTGAVAQEAAGQPAKTPSESPDRGAKPDDAKRQALIESLRALRREPEKVPFHSAMCYDMTMPPESVSYTCETCSDTTELPYRGLGELSREVPYLKRSLADLPVKVHLDASPLCSKCGAGKTPGIELTTDCGECGKSFTWTITRRPF